MGEKISAIVPIYKVEQYLNRCIDSIINQTYTNLEIILVDDGSPDNCPKICDEYAKVDDRIKVIHKENGGLSDARNAGLNVATGDYIGFIDSDDWVHKDMYKILYKIMMEEKSDIVECNAKKINKYLDDMEVNLDFKSFNYNKEESIEALISENTVQQTVWNKLYKKDVIENILFEKGKFHEDEFWTYQIFHRCDKLVHVDIDLYYYFQREDSIMGESYSINRLDAIQGRYNRYLFIKDNYPKYVQLEKINLFYICLYYFQQSLLKSNDEEYRVTKEFIKKYMKLIEINIKNVDLKTAIWILISKISLTLCGKIRNFFNIGVR